jgi:ribosomal protein S27E
MSEFQMLEISIAVYLAIGVVLVCIGPVAENISREIDQARGTPMSNAFMQREQPPESKLLLARITITVGFVLLWVVFIWGVLKEHWNIQATRKRVQERSKGLWFSYIGGHGTVKCKDCDHNEEITSFLHGINSSSTGFQCQACGKFAAIASGGPGKANEYEESLVCRCGGSLDREKIIFCSSCKSKNLSYQTLYIT